MNSRIFLFSKTPYPDVRHIPILETSYLQPTIDFSSYDYIIATSKEVFRSLDRIGSWKALPILAISEATADYARSLGCQVLDVADGYGDSVVDVIKSHYSTLRALHPHAKVIAYDINKALMAAQIAVDSFVVYETKCAMHAPINLPENAICIFTSPSSVHCFRKVQALLESYQIVCIGETTRLAFGEGVEVTVAQKRSIESCVMAAKVLL